MKYVLPVLVMLPLTALSQQPTLPHQARAGEIIRYFLGEEIFVRYVEVDLNESKTTTSGCFFHYNFDHPKLSGKEFVIAFILDTTGQFIPGEETRGLIHITNSDSTWITKRGALKTCRKQAYRLKKRSLRLAWDPTTMSYEDFQMTKDFRDIVPGSMIWQVDGEVLFRGERYAGTFEVNVLTGAVTRRFAIPWD
jgi:hypothetical protein